MVGVATPTALYTEDTSAEMARFSSAPGGNAVICDGIDCLLWGGDESQIASFITSVATITTSATNPRDYLDEVRNTINSATERAIIGGGIDSDAVLMLHMDEPDGGTDFDDSSASAHATTPSNDTQTDSSQIKWGVSSGLFDGTDDDIKIGDHADFDFSADDIFTIDVWVRFSNVSKIQSIYYQDLTTDATDYFQLRVNADNTISGEVFENGSGQTITTTGTVSAGTWYHIAFIGDGSKYYIALDGDVEGTGTAITQSTLALDEQVTIGRNEDDSEDFDGWMDEYRVSGVARWTADFTTPIRAYSDDALDFLVGSTRPLDGVKFYSGVANEATSTLTGKYWDGNSWISLSSLSDGTSSGGISLAQTGWVRWDTTVDLAKQAYLESDYLFWYNFTLSAGEAEIYHVTLDAPMQKINDIWDGEFVSIGNAQIFKTIYTESAVPVFELDFVDNVETTYWSLDGDSTADFYVFGFTERITALDFEFALANISHTVATSAVFYWDGSGWASVGDITDGTLGSGGTATFGSSGVMSWNPPDEGSEFKTKISDSAPLYFYKVVHSDNFVAEKIYLDYVAGIPVSKIIASYKFPMHSKDRLFLCSEQSQDKNKCIGSAVDTPNVFNGSDFVELFFGNETELTGGTSLYSRLGSAIYEVALFFKRDVIYGLTGFDNEDFTKYLISDTVGLVAPLTLQTTTIQTPQGSKPIVIWQGADGVYLFDNSSVILISEDIANLFDDRESGSRVMNPNYINDSVSFIDHDYHEYHWLFADTYGLSDEGDMLRLENGNTFDSDNMTFTLWTGAFTPNNGSIMWNSKPIRHKLVMKSKANTTSTVAITHYLDRKSTGTSYTSADPTNAGFSIADVLQDGNIIYGKGIFHSYKYSITTNNETVGFEPIAIGQKYDIIDEDKY